MNAGLVANQSTEANQIQPQRRIPGHVGYGGGLNRDENIGIEQDSHGRQYADGMTIRCSILRREFALQPRLQSECFRGGRPGARGRLVGGLFWPVR